MDFRALHAYDRWANLRWLAYLESIGSPATEMAVLGHHLAAAKMWAGRLQGDHSTSLPDLTPTEAEIEAVAAAWTEAIDQGIEGEVTFRRFNGEEVTSTVASIALHVGNHGTYHRGELRGLCRAAGRTDFPETDFFMWDRLGRP